MAPTLLEIKDFLKCAIYVWKVVSRLPTYWRLKSLFGPLIGRKNLLYISLPSIYFRCTNGQKFQAYKRRGSMPGYVSTDIPWIRPHDSYAASHMSVLLSEFIGKIEIVSDEDIERKMMSENLICIGGQTNWLFEEFVIKQKILFPLEYRIDQEKRFDGFYNLEMDKSYESQDKKYSYGILAVVRNPQAYNKRIVFISGLDAKVTLEMPIILRNNLKKIYQRKKLIGLFRSDFYCVWRFERTGDRLVPLTFVDIFIGRISNKTNLQQSTV
jgi:hypothetical protein